MTRRLSLSSGRISCSSRYSAIPRCRNFAICCRTSSISSSSEASSCGQAPRQEESSVGPQSSYDSDHPSSSPVLVAVLSVPRLAGTVSRKTRKTRTSDSVVGFMQQRPSKLRDMCRQRGKGMADSVLFIGHSHLTK